MKKRMVAAAVSVAALMTCSNGWAENNSGADLTNMISLSGLIEMEAAAGKDFADASYSDIALATIELGIDAEISSWSSGHILFLYEDGTNFDVDEGTITLADSDKSPFYLTVGKMYVPFGNFSTSMVSDPLTLELGETNEDALLVGFTKNNFYGSAYVFNGDTEETGKDDAVSSMGMNFGYSFEKEGFNLDVGIGWISNIGDSDGLSEGLTLGADNDIADQVSGSCAHLAYSNNGYGLTVEYVSAIDEFNQTELDFNGQGAKPSAWNVEMSYSSEISGHETTFAVGYQGTTDALALELPETKYLGAVDIGLMENTNLAIEITHGEDYEVADGGTGNSVQTMTAKLAIEF